MLTGTRLPNLSDTAICFHDTEPQGVLESHPYVWCLHSTERGVQGNSGQMAGYLLQRSGKAQARLNAF